METVQDNIFFGNGPAKAIKNTWVDNSYLKFISEFGLLGVTLYLIFLGHMIWFVFSQLKYLDIINADYLIVFMMMLFSWIIFEFTTDAWSEARCAPIFLSFYAVTKSVISARRSSP